MDNQKTEKEAMLWKQAKKRVGFKNHLYAYLLVNAFLWIMWLVKGHPADDETGMPLPLFCSLGWGFGLAWHYIGVFVLTNKLSSVEKEYEKLKERNGSF